jgi:hypothetical protein
MPLSKVDIQKQYAAFCVVFHILPLQASVGFGAAMVMHELINETNDIDLEVSQYFFTWFSRQEDVRGGVFTRPDGTHVPFLTHKDFPLIDVHVVPSGTETELLDGVMVHTLEEILKTKLALNRPKDQEGIKLVRAKIESLTV